MAYVGILYDVFWEQKIDGLVQERRNSIANALRLRLSCTTPSKYFGNQQMIVALHIYPVQRYKTTAFSMNWLYKT